MAGSRLPPSGCGSDARPRALEHRTLLEQPGDHCGVEIGADVYDHAVAEIHDPAIMVVEPLACRPWECGRVEACRRELRCYPAARANKCVAPGRRLLDRKSTRLNSSHV